MGPPVVPLAGRIRPVSNVPVSVPVVSNLTARAVASGAHISSHDSTVGPLERPR
jgi:hypothetical protein